MNKSEMIKGAIYGVAIGDALGAPCEFMQPNSLRTRYGVHNKMIKSWVWAEGEFTDDTWLTLATIRAYENYKKNGLQANVAGAAMVTWMLKVGKGIGNMTKRALDKIKSG